MKIRSTNVVLLVAGMVVALTVGESSADLLVDFNARDADTPITQSGWEAFSASTDVNNKTVNYSGHDGLAGAGNDVSITTAGVEFSRNGGVPTTHALTNMLSDLVLRNDEDNPLTITIGGLREGTYHVTTYHHSTGNTIGTRSSFDLDVQDGDSPVFGQSEGTFQMGFGETPTSHTFSINSNGSDDVIIRMTGNTFDVTSNWIGFNGLEIVAPTPGTLIYGK